ncbi:hypothetical protein BSKO_01574 [Bryopsis sp. KO-2023]|nr:hypothetical protein BSKO_01574 [Bryopsis sp. KO-2023]
MTAGTAVAALIRAIRPTFRNAHDRVAFAVHAVVLSEGYALVGLGDVNHKEIPTPDSPEVDIEGWNSMDGVYSFRYVDSGGEKPPLLVKCLVVGPSLLTNYLVLGKDQPPETEAVDDVTEYITDSEDLIKGYKNFGDLVGRLTNAVRGISESKGRTPESKPVDPPKAPHTDPLRDGPAQRPHPAYVGGPRYPYYPGGQGGVMPDMGMGVGGLGGGRMGGGMHVGPNDPMFRGGVRYPEMPGRPGLGVPRFDPIAPLGMPGSRPEDFQRGEPFRGDPRNLDPDMEQLGPGLGPDSDRMFG